MLKDTIKKLVEHQDLTQQESSDIIDLLAEGKVPPSEIGAFLVALKMKGETTEELTGFALKMRERAEKINVNGIDDIVDSSGTGGDLSNTFNISTATAILTSASGLTVAKHSNIGFTSRSGSSNVVECLGIRLVKTAREVENNLSINNIAFIHAPYFHKSTSYVNSVRKEIGIRTVFNFLGPLTNPTKPTGQVLGVSDPSLCSKMIESLKNLGTKKALVVCGHHPTLDELSVCGQTLIYRLDNGIIDSFEAHPEDFGLKTYKIGDILGDTPEYNAGIIEDALNGKVNDAKLYALVLNSAALLWTGNKADSIEAGIKLALDLIYSGKAVEKLEEIRY